MAKRKSTYEIIFGAVNNTGKAIGDISKGLNGIASPAADAANAILKLDAAIVAMVGGGLALAVKKFADYEDVMLKVKGITGANEEQYKKLSEQTQELGTSTRFTAKEAAEGLQFLAQAGFDVEKSYKALPDVLNLASAAALDLGRTSDIVTNIMTGYGIAAEDLAKTNDILVKTFTSTNTNLDQLGSAFEFVGPVAKSLDIDFKEVAAAVGLLGNAGFQGEKGGTALRNILLSLVAPTTNMSKLMEKLGVSTEEFGIDISSSRNALKSLGVEVKGADGKLKPLTDLFGDLKTKLDEIPSSADRSATAVQIFGKRGGPQLLALLNQGLPAFDSLKKNLDESGGAAKKLAEEMESGLGGALRSLNSAFEGFFIRIGAEIQSGPIDGFAEFFRSAANAVKGDTFDPIFKILNETGERIGNTLKKIAELLPEALEGVDYTGFIKAFEGLSDTLSDAFGVADLTTAKGLNQAIQSIVDTGTSLISITKGIIEAWGPFFTAVGEAVDSFNDLDAGTKEFIGNLGGVAQQVVLLGGGLTVIGISIKAVGFAMSGFSGVAASITAVAGSAATAAAGLVAVAGVIGAAIGTLIRLIPGVDDLTQSLIGLIDEAITGTNLNDLKVGESEEDLKNKVDALAKYRKNIKGIKDDAKEPVKISAEVDAGSLTELQRKIGEAFSQTQKDFRLDIDPDSINDSTNLVKTKFKETLGDVAQSIKQLEDGSYVIELLPELEGIGEVEEKIDKLTKDREFVLKIETEKIKAETEQVTTRIKEQSKIISEALKFKYELDIKQSEIAFQTFDTAVKSSTALAIEATKANTSLFGSFSADKLDLEALSLWRQQVRQNLSVQERQATIQEKILEQTLEEIKLRNQLKRDLITGEKAALRITIDDRLGPMLTAAVKEAIPYLQLWGETEDAAEFLIEAAG